MVPKTARPAKSGQSPGRGFRGTRFTASSTLTSSRATKLRKKAFSAVGTSPARRTNTVIMEKPKAAKRMQTMPLVRWEILFMKSDTPFLGKQKKHPQRDAQRVKKASQSLPPAGGKEIKSFSLATCA